MPSPKPKPPEPNPGPSDVAPFVHDFLVARHPALFSVNELTSEFTGPDEGENERFLIEEAIIRLVACGLAHRLGDFVFASRAAVRGVAFSHWGAPGSD
jgi:hypothetical protein